MMAMKSLASMYRTALLFDNLVVTLITINVTKPERIRPPIHFPTAAVAMLQLSKAILYNNIFILYYVSLSGYFYMIVYILI